MLTLPRPLVWALVFFAALLPARSALAQFEGVEIVRAFPELTFEQPLALASDGTEHLYVGEYAGRVLVFDRTAPGEGASVFLDLTDRIGDADPQGQFYAVAFHPDYAQNGYVYVSYLAGGDPYRSVVARYTRSAEDPLAVDLATELVLFDFDQPSIDHNGGDLAFGPDGYLYVVFGDGQCCGDPLGNAQDPSTLFGSFLRIDVDNPTGDLNYGIPPDNPFVGNTEGWREEIWAYGFRNPWQFSFDRLSGELWAGDVGGLEWEEVDVVAAGGNYGWPIMEGPECLGSEPCDQTGLTLPVWAYTHDEGISITGGHVYRGADAPMLWGHYVFADWGLEKMWVLDMQDPLSPESVALAPPEGSPSPGFVTSFAEDEVGELYFTTFFRGWIYKFMSPSVSNESAPETAQLDLKPAFPNPVQGRGTLRFSVGEPSPVRLSVYDVLGREVAVLYEGTATAAEQTVTFDVGGLPSGIYVVRLEAAGTTVSRRVTIAR